MNYFTHILQPGGLVFDIGANMGQSTHRYLLHKTIVVAVEPLKRCCEYIKKRYPSVTVINAAVSPEPQLTIYDAGTVSTAVPALWWTGRFAGYEPRDTFVIKTVTIASLIEEYGNPRYIKVDCEGCDFYVLQTLPADTSVPFITFEHSSEHCEQTLSTIALLRDFGYEYFEYLRGGFNPHFSQLLPAREFTSQFRTVGTATGGWGDVLCTQEPL